MKKRKILSIFLALAMVLSLLPVSALAAGDSLPDAVNGVITLTEDVTLSDIVKPSESITLDLNGHTLTLPRLDAAQGVTVTVIDSSADKDGKIISDGANTCAVFSGGTLILEAGTIENTSDGGNAVFNMGTLTVKGGTVKGETGVYNTAWNGQTAVTGNIVCNIEGGTVDAEIWGVCVMGPGIQDGDLSTVDNSKLVVNISGGTIIAEQGIAGNASSGTRAGFTVNMTAGEIKDHAGAGTGMYLPSIGVTNISGGSVTAAQAIRICAGELNVTGGTITCTAVGNGEDLIAGGSGGTTGAIVVGKAGNGYVGDIKVNVSGSAVIENTASGTDSDIHPTIVVSDKNMAQSSEQSFKDPATGNNISATYQYSETATSVVVNAQVKGDIVKISNVTQSTVTQDGGNTSLDITGGSVTGDVINQTSAGDLNVAGTTVTGDVKNDSAGAVVISDGAKIDGAVSSTKSGNVAILNSTVTGTAPNDATIINSTVNNQEHTGDNYVVLMNGKGYDSLQAAINAAASGDTVTLLKDHYATSEGTITFNADKDVTLDLGGNKLTLSRFNLVQGWLTVKNGSVKCDPTNGQAFNVYAGPTATEKLYTKLVIEDDVTINAAYGICLFPSSGNAGYSSAIEVYGKIESGGIFVSGNLGNDTNTAGSMVSSNKIPTITIHEGAVVSNGTEGQGIAMNGLANVTVEGGTITGSEAIGVKRGTLTVNEGTFRSNGKYVDPADANNNGTENTGATISITSTYNYAGTINVNLNGGTFTSENAPAVYQGHSRSGETTNTYTQGVTLNIQGGTFTSPDNVPTVYVAAKADGDADTYTQQVISGGSFGSSVNENFLNDTIKAELKSAANTEAPYSYYTSMEAALAAAKTGDSVKAVNQDTTTTYYTLTLDYNDNATADSVYEVETGTQITLPTPPSRTNYTFNGWYDENNTKVEGPYTVSKTETLTARWSYISSGGTVTPSYTVTVKTAENGALSADKSTAKAGDTVTLTVTPAEGYVLASLTVTDKDGKTVATDTKDGKYTFKMPASNVNVTALFAAIPVTLPFTDVAVDDWFYQAVYFAYSADVMHGVSGTLFAPNTDLTRAMIAQMFYNLEGGVPGAPAAFDDVASDAWYADAVNWAASTGIVAGFGNGIFGPDEPITREQLAVIIYRYAQFKGAVVPVSGDLSAFNDGDDVSAWAADAMTWAVQTGLIAGMGNNTLSPQGTATRAQVATILMRFITAMV